MEPPEGFRGFQRASSMLGSLPRAFRRAPKAFNHSGRSSKDFTRHAEGFLRLSKVAKRSQWEPPQGLHALTSGFAAGVIPERAVLVGDGPTVTCECHERTDYVS